MNVGLESLLSRNKDLAELIARRLFESYACIVFGA